MIYTKANFKESKYLELPKDITNLINKEDYRASYKANNIYIISLLIRNQTKFKSLEIEYDTEKNRFLTREERELKVPKDRELFFSEYGVEIFIQYFLEEETDILKESYQIYSLDTNEKLERYTQDFFSMKRTFKDKAKEACKIEKEKKTYIKSTNSEKVAYWAGKIDQWERNFGVIDMPKIDFLDSIGLNGIRKKEPDIDALMPFILKKLATWWEYDIDDFFERVNHNLGTEYRNK